MEAASVRPPNIILILADDLGWADLGCYGNRYHKTPHLDALAKRGVRFTSAYAAPVCSPTRASLMTGKHPARLQLTDWLPGRRDMPSQQLLRPNIRQQLPLEEQTIAELLRDHSYSCANIGKWHLGNAEFGPEVQGFNLNIAGDHRGTPVSYFHPYSRGNESMPHLHQGEPEEYLTDRLSSEAESFIKQNKDRPFFLYLPHFTVHIPLVAKKELVAKYEKLRSPGVAHTNAIYAAMIESLDESIGRIVKQLSDLNLVERTLIVFMSDNGGLSVKEGPHTPATSNAPLRAGKGHLYEGGIRVPLIVHWTGEIKGNRVIETPVASEDVFATLAEFAGNTNALKNVDGVSLAPLLKESGVYERKRIYTHYPHYSNQGGKPGSAIREGRFKLIEFFENNSVELYDLSTDVSEGRNLAKDFPEKALALRRQLHEWRQNVNAQMMQPNLDYSPGAALRN